MNGAFTNALWYIEFFVFAIVLITFFCFFLYLASINYVRYGPKYDYRKKQRAKNRAKHPPKLPVDNKPVCFDKGCIWFCGLVASIVTIGLCYYLAYALLSDTKLRFGLFMP